MGHLLLDVLQAPLVALILWSVVALCHLSPGSFSDIALVALFSLALGSTVTSIVERPFVVAANHSAPGGLAYALCSFIPPPICGAIVGATYSSGHAVAAAAAMALCQWTFLLWLRPWRRGGSQAEVGRKMRLTQEMTDDMRLEDGWVGPAKNSKK